MLCDIDPPVLRLPFQKRPGRAGRGRSAAPGKLFLWLWLFDSPRSHSLTPSIIFRLGAIVSFSSHPYIPAENDGSERAGKERQRGGGARRVQWGPAPRHRRFCHLRPSPSLHQQRGSRTHLSLSRALITRLLLARYM
jgi:hypothetical protein